MEPEDIESNSSICKDDELQDEFYNNNLWWTNGILLVCVAAIGIFLNATSLYIIQSKKSKRNNIQHVGNFSLHNRHFVTIERYKYIYSTTFIKTVSIILCQPNIIRYL